MGGKLFVIAGVAAFVACASRNAAAESLNLEQSDTALRVTAGDVTLMQYRFAEVPFKPYVQELYTPEGFNVLRDAPHDHLHHHALMFAIIVDGVNYWEEVKGCGKQADRALTPMPEQAQGGLQMAGLTERIEWVPPGTEMPALKEQRTITVGQAPDAEATLLSWESKLSLPDGKDSAELGGAHYHGLGMRFPTAMDKDGTFQNDAGAVGEVVRGDEMLTNAKWCAYTVQAGEKTVTVAMFDHPQNARHPAKWFTMHTPFAYLSATLNLWKEPLEIKAGQPLLLRYGVAAWDGEVPKEKIEALYQRWMEVVSAAAK